MEISPPRHSLEALCMLISEIFYSLTGKDDLTDPPSFSNKSKAPTSKAS
jgi:hypothetical protein